MPDLSRRQSSRQKENRGEDLALRYLARKGYEILECNYMTRYGEIDLVVRDERALVFVEVKLRRGTEFGDPVEAVVPGKQTRLRLMAEQYLAGRENDFVAGFGEMRFDVVGILATRAGRPSTRHVEDAF